MNPRNIPEPFLLRLSGSSYLSSHFWIICVVLATCMVASCQDDEADPADIVPQLAGDEEMVNELEPDEPGTNTPEAEEPGADEPTTPEPEIPGTDEAKLVTRTFTESSDDFVNPERGFYVSLDLLSSTGAAQVRSRGHSLAIAIVRLDAYRNKPLDSALLAALDRGFTAVRAAGIKVILRFAYNASLSDGDASKARILEHIGQLGPVLQRNGDVIAVLQAGFIGAWGEWHSSSNGLDNDADRTAILRALVAAMPATRFVQVRTPMFKAAAYPGGPLRDLEAFGTSAKARVGFHNDCFLASDSDFGTYAAPVADWKALVANDSRFSPVGGETCAVNAPRSRGASAIDEMTRHHWSYVNLEYHLDVISSWKADHLDDDISRQLGYRFALKRVAHGEKVAPGGELTVEIVLVNRGFASPFNARLVYLVLTGETGRQTARLRRADPRRWKPGEVTTLTTRLRIPATAKPGAYRLSLWLPDAASTLRGDPRYAIRLANQGTWVEATGDNLLSDKLVIDPAAPGPVDPKATELVELP